jgi:hypothetical protein
VLPRSILLRVLFISLALAAVFGAGGILFGSSTAIWHTAGTAILTAVASMLLLTASAKIDQPAARPAALLGITLVVVLYILTLGAIWQIERTLFGRWDERLWLLILFVILTGIPAIGLMRLAFTPYGAIAGRVGLVIDAIVLSFLVIELGDRSWGTLDELACSLALFGGIAVICLIGAGRGDRRYWRWIGVVASAIGLFIAAYASINHVPHTDVGERVMVYIIAAAAAVAHANIIMLSRLRPSQAWLRIITITAGVATALFTALAVQEHSGDTFERLAGACGIVAGCGTLATAVLAKINKRFAPPAASIADVRPVQINCPLCGKKQTLAVGRSNCPACNVIIDLRVEEPRCGVCNYALLMLKSDKCPECGTPVNAPAPAVAVPTAAAQG